MKFTSFILLICLITAWQFSAAQPDRNAARLLEMKQYNQAKNAFASSLSNSSNAANWFYLGKIYSILAKTDSAAFCFAKINATDPKNALNLVGQAFTEKLSGNQAQSFITLDKAQKSAIASKDVLSLIEIAELRMQGGDTLKWPATLELASGIEKNNPKPYIASGNFYADLGDRSNLSRYYGLASGRYHQALYLEPDNVEALTQLAAIDIKMLNYEDAEIMLNKALLKDTTYVPALKNMGEMLYVLGRYRESSLYYGKYIRLAETNEKDLARYINILYFNKEYLFAAGYINRVLKKNPSNAVMLRLSGYTAYELNQNQQGLDAMKKFFELRSVVDTSKVIASDYEYYGKLLARSGNDSLAIVNLLKAVEMDAANAGLLEDVARLHEKQKNYTEAILSFEKLIKARNENVTSMIYFSMGKDLLLLADNAKGKPDSLLRTDYLKKAERAFGKVVSLSPNSYLGYQWRARALAGMDPETLKGLAKEDYEKALTMLESKNDTKKYAGELIEALRYLGYFHYLKYESIKKTGDATEKEHAKTESLLNWQKILAIDPANAVAKQAIEALK